MRGEEHCFVLPPLSCGFFFCFLLLLFLWLLVTRPSHLIAQEPFSLSDFLRHLPSKKEEKKNFFEFKKSKKKKLLFCHTLKKKGGRIFYFLKS